MKFKLVETVREGINDIRNHLASLLSTAGYQILRNDNNSSFLIVISPHNTQLCIVIKNPSTYNRSNHKYSSNKLSSSNQNGIVYNSPGSTKGAILGKAAIVTSKTELRRLYEDSVFDVYIMNALNADSNYIINTY